MSSSGGWKRDGAPLAGQRWVTVTARRTRLDRAHLIRERVDVRNSGAERLALVQDDLNAHTRASLYEAFPPAEARRPAAKRESHSTPEHGCWLNIAGPADGASGVMPRHGKRVTVIWGTPPGRSQ